jgi:hypothetical protein
MELPLKVGGSCCGSLTRTAYSDRWLDSRCWLLTSLMGSQLKILRDTRRWSFTEGTSGR